MVNRGWCLASLVCQAIFCGRVEAIKPKARRGGERRFAIAHNKTAVSNRRLQDLSHVFRVLLPDQQHIRHN
jgi:hypothetical protein